MSYFLDSDIQEDLRTFRMYQRLRKINPYAYYSLNTQKQMQLDLRISGSPNFFMVNPDTIPEIDEPKGTITLPEALAKAELLIDTGSTGFNETTETIVCVHRQFPNTFFGSIRSHLQVMVCVFPLHSWVDRHLQMDLDSPSQVLG